VAAILRTDLGDTPLVVDPVMVAKGGASLLADEAVAAIRTELLPLATLVTPNLPECQALIGFAPDTEAELRDAARRFGDLGAQNVLFKGGHASGEIVRDVLADGEGASLFVLEAPRLETPHTHGTGCTLASAIASGLAQGRPLREAVKRAHAYVQQAIRTAPGLGAGHGPLNHFVKP
jgi:hydroxymethylpyrimidine/phosphomethylpyrimidine kinase